MQHGLSCGLRTRAQPILHRRWNDIAGVASDQRTIVSWMLLAPGAWIFERSGPQSGFSAARFGLGCAIRTGPIGISQRPAGADHRLAEVAAPGAAYCHRTAETILGMRLALHGFVSDQFAQLDARTPAARPIASGRVAAFLVQFGCVDALQANSLSAELDGVSVSHTHGRGVRHGSRAGKRGRHQRQNQSEDDSFHDAVIILQSCSGVAAIPRNQQKNANGISARIIAMPRRSTAPARPLQPRSMPDRRPPVPRRNRYRGLSVRDPLRSKPESSAWRRA